MTHKDQLGLAVTAASAPAVAAFDHTIDEYLVFGRDTGRHLKETLTADADMVMGHVLRGYFFQLMRLPALLPRADQALAAAEARAESVTPRERLHVAALKAWCKGDFEGAIEAWEAILRDHPRDILALKLANHLHFYLGDSAQIRASVERVLPVWSADDPRYGFVLGMHAFGLEETGDYRAAERIGRKAVELHPRDAWGTHAVAHVLDTERRCREGIEWIASLEPHWNAGNHFRYHLWWHRALMHLALGELDATLAMYDECIWDAESDEYLDLCNNVALLARLELKGVDVGNRWQALADKAEKHVDTRSLSFIDTHGVLALAAAGRSERVTGVLESLRRYADESTQTTARVTREVGLPLCEALVAWRSGDHATAANTLKPLHNRILRIGGSHTQRDLFTQILARLTG